ncbi:hypothetical protein DFH09DRAFT_1041350 [Mycena vulgaris]|nr:hypothetical protein DFH09DRAFT_1041350 [Mycena vulgaris]
MATTLNLARASLRQLSRVAILPSRHIHSTPVAFKKKKGSKEVVDLFDDEEEWGAVQDLIPSGKPKQAPSSSAVVASTSSPASSPAPIILKKRQGSLSKSERLHKYNELVEFVRPRVGRHPTKKSPLVRRSIFPQLIQLAASADHLRTITELMVPWKEGRLGTQGAARFRADGQPKGVNPFDEPTSELFARRCEELGIPEHALEVYGAFATYALPLTLPAARRLLHSLVAAERPLADVLTAAALYTPHGLPPAHDDLPSCALLLAACLRHLKTVGAEGKEHADATAAVDELLAALRARLASAEPMPNSRDIRDKTVRLWLKGVMLDVNEFLRGREQPRDWLEAWMARSRFIPSPS